MEDHASPLRPVDHYGILGSGEEHESPDDLITSETPLLCVDGAGGGAGGVGSEDRTYAPLATHPIRDWSHTALTKSGRCMRCWMRIRVRMQQCPGFSSIDKWLWFLSGPKYVRGENLEDPVDDPVPEGMDRWLPRVAQTLKDPAKRRRCCIRSTRCCCRWIRFPRASFRAWWRRQSVLEVILVGAIAMFMVFALPILLQHSYPALWYRSRTWGYAPMKPYTSHMLEMFGPQYEVAEQCESFLRAQPDVACVSAVELGESYHHVCLRRRTVDPSSHGRRRASTVDSYVHFLNPVVTRTNKTVETGEGWTLVKLRYFDVDEKWIHCVYPEPGVPSEIEAKRTTIHVAMQNMTMTNRRDYYRKQARLRAQKDALDQVIESMRTPPIHRATRQSHVQVSYLDLEGSTRQVSLYDMDAICVQYYDDVYRGTLKCTRGE